MNIYKYGSIKGIYDIPFGMQRKYARVNQLESSETTIKESELQSQTIV